MARITRRGARWPVRRAGGPSASLRGVLDHLRRAFPFVVALVFPLAGAILAAARFVEGDREDGVRLLGVTLLGVAIYALFVFG
jgi:hypothetical protein